MFEELICRSEILCRIYNALASTSIGIFEFVKAEPILALTALAAAALPAAIWLYIFFSKSEKSKKTVGLIFFLGTLTAPALLLLQVLWSEFPQFDLSTFIEGSFQKQTTMFVFMFLLFASMEEIIKLYVVKIVDQKTILINSINDALRYSVTAALGFAFAENIYYFTQFWPSLAQGELIGMYVFRTLFTACAHMIFSGVFGYYYGIGKFSMVVQRQHEIGNKTSKVAKFISSLFHLPLSEGYRQKLVLRGLLTAIFMHTVFNYLLQFNIMPPVIIFVIGGYFFLQYLLKRKSGHLVLLADPSTKRASTMNKKDEDVVIELTSMWLKEGRYLDVIDICARLSHRDPDNNVVKMFKARAMDEMSKKSAYREILSKVQIDKSIIKKHIDEKAMFEQVKLKIRQQLEKEGKTFKEAKKKKVVKKKSKKLLDNYTGQGTFKIG